MSKSKILIDRLAKLIKEGLITSKDIGEEIKNLALIQQCYALYKTMHTKITIRHVKGHANIEGNELADRMAVLARKQQQVPMIRYAQAIDIKTILAQESG